MREPLLGAVCGKKGVGKTYETFGMLLDYVRGTASYAEGGMIVQPRRVLILDVNDEYGAMEYGGLVYNVRSIARENVEKFSVHPNIEIRRIRTKNTDGTTWGLNEIAETLYYILENYSGGLLLIEDINKYISDSLPNDLIGAICTNRHRDLDIIAQFQSLGRLTPKFWQNLSWIRLHACGDSIEKHRAKADDYYKIVKIAENIINKQYLDGNIRYHNFIDLEGKRINGKYNYNMLHDAVIEYMIENERSVLIPYMKKQKILKEEFSEVGLSVLQKRELDNRLREQLAEEIMLDCCRLDMIA